MRLKCYLIILVCTILSACGQSGQEENERVIIGNEYKGMKSLTVKRLARLGDSNARNQDFGNALDCYLKADSVEPNNPNVLNALANIEGHMGKTDESIVHFKKVIQLDSNYLQAYASYGTILGEVKRYPEAMAILKKGFERSKQDQFEYYVLSFNLAIYSYKIGNCEDADKYIAIAKMNRFRNENFNTETIKTANIIKRDCN
ncbi:hypothetical protein G7074_02990 [Pedobacter sp. HDW13]|uniref:tetratricopeptide repeat protein n=1 Tax=Pedobacter sp. HDW13 TaxID=2714940 RepID=UPI00140BB3ED|nr:hypothetical protein [Pedobacter sp. HDW13]QIL38334.1 hypothetical protein G7074_02990 [Pedobacter sp. HDW13]